MSSSTSYIQDHHLSSSEQLCYVHCNYCDTVLAVNVPCSSLLKMVNVRCGHCTNFFSVNMSGLLHQLHISYPSVSLSDKLTDENPRAQNLFISQPKPNDSKISAQTTTDEPSRPSLVKRSSEKRQRVPSAYNRFIKEEIQRIKAGNPNITHKEAFSAAAKNWAHFPHVNFGLVPGQNLAKADLRQKEGKDVLMKEGFSCS